MGQHGDTDYVASLNLRIIQIRHEPSVIEGGHIPQTCLMSDFSTSSCNTMDDLWELFSTPTNTVKTTQLCPPTPQKLKLVRQNQMLPGDKTSPPQSTPNKKIKKVTITTA